MKKNGNYDFFIMEIFVFLRNLWYVCEIKEIK
jgi:hypothetical protein